MLQRDVERRLCLSQPRDFCIFTPLLEKHILPLMVKFNGNLTYGKKIPMEGKYLWKGNTMKLRPYSLSLCNNLMKGKFNHE